jgi:short-subunit dehydrogenase
MTTIAGRVFVVTGASSGIGEATAKAAARAGAKVCLVARREQQLERIAEEIRGAGGEAEAFAADLTDREAVSALAVEISERVGAPEILINNAGAGAWKYVEETDAGEVEQMMAAPYFAAFYLTRELLPGMLARGAGFIVNVTSVVAHFAISGATGYASARWAMRGFSEALGQDLHGSGVKVALATFAKVDSDYFSTNPNAADRLPGAQALVRVLSPEQAAEAIVEGVERDADQIVSPIELRGLLLAGRLAPGLMRWILRVTGHRRG